MTMQKSALERTKRAARTIVATAGATTALARSVPDFLIVGAQRCGTTSVHRMLADHPAVVPPLLHKGVHYFDTASHYARGFAWYRGHFPLGRTLRRRSGGVRARAITGEASPYYLYHPLAAHRIAQDLPKARIIVLLRDPVERAYSAHKQECARGFETEPFEHAIELESLRLEGEEDRIRSELDYQSYAHQHHAYVARGEYAAQLTRLFRAVGREQVLVVDVQGMFNEEFDKHWARILDFLGLPIWTPRRPQRANARPSPPMPAIVRQQLTEHFRPHDEQLTDLLGCIPSWRRSDG